MWCKRWLNDETYRLEYNAATLNHQNETEPIDTQHQNNEPSLDGNESHNDDFHPDLEDESDEDAGFLRAIGIEDRKMAALDTVTYQSLTEKMQELARLVQRDKGMLDLVESSIVSMIERVRNKKSIRFEYVEDTRLENDDVNNVNVGRVGFVPNPSNMNRLRSRHEISASYRTQRKRPRPSNDEEYAQNNVKTKSCRFCRQSGHTINHCPKILCYGEAPLKTQTSRSNFVSNLNQPGYFSVTITQNNEKREIADNFPPRTKGIVVHFKSTKLDGEIYFATTVLDDFGNPHHIYNKYPFLKGAITKFICRSQSSIVISLLKPKEDGYESFGFPTFTQQLSQRSDMGSVSLPGLSVTFPDYSQGQLSQMTNNNMIGYSQSSFLPTEYGNHGWGSQNGQI